MFFLCFSSLSALIDIRAPPLTFIADVEEETKHQYCNQSSQVTEAGNKEIARNRIMENWMHWWFITFTKIK